MNNDKPLTPINDERSERYYPNTRDPRHIKEIIPEALSQQDEEVSLELLLHVSMMLKRELKETPVEKRDAIKVGIWNRYKETCLFWESIEDFIGRMQSDLGQDWLFKLGIA